MKSIRSIILAVLAIAFAAGCGSDSTGPAENHGQGTLKFNYSGAFSGGFMASGKPKYEIGSGIAHESFAVAFRDDTTGIVAVAAFQLKTGTTGDMALFIIEKEEVGSYDFNGNECEGNCASAIYYFDMNFADSLAVDARVFVADSGEIRLTRVTAEALEGIFSGSAIEAADENERLLITNGSFSAPLVDYGLDIPVGTLIPPVTSLETAATTIEGFDLLSAPRQARVLEVFEQLRKRR